MLALTKWLSKVSDGNDNVAVYVLISLFEATSPLEDDDGSPEVARAFSDPHLFVAVSSALNSRWQNADLHSAMLLQYSLFHLEVRSRDTHVRGEVSVIEDEVGASLKKAISAGAFQAITRISFDPGIRDIVPSDPSSPSVRITQYCLDVLPTLMRLMSGPSCLLNFECTC